MNGQRYWVLAIAGEKPVKIVDSFGHLKRIKKALHKQQMHFTQHEFGTLEDAERFRMDALRRWQKEQGE